MNTAKCCTRHLQQCVLYVSRQQIFSHLNSQPTSNAISPSPYSALSRPFICLYCNIVHCIYMNMLYCDICLCLYDCSHANGLGC
ncbi:hypothetical protein XELAEV_18030800mg [Xenopus laevis]|uniref:Uncharacterized protein n=1 Tax=Xenopus laevis TaxID=8355 RepID=A0A974HFG6_XENLA|nr:hypothetical protein XELAEV_18030800mg [Xenopus laevis]